MTSLGSQSNSWDETVTVLFLFVLSGHRMQSACFSLVSFRIQDSGNGLHRCGNQDHGGLSPARTYTSPSGHAPAAIWICGHQGLSAHSILVILFKLFISNRGRTSLTAEREVAGFEPRGRPIFGILKKPGNESTAFALQTAIPRCGFKQGCH